MGRAVNRAIQQVAIRAEILQPHALPYRPSEHGIHQVRAVVNIDRVGVADRAWFLQAMALRTLTH